MSETLIIRESTSDDLADIESLYPKAFPDEDLLALVRDLLSNPQFTTSLAATLNDKLVGHVVFTDCRIADNEANVALLAPLAVSPACQRQGIGSALVRAGLQRMRDSNVDAVFVLGDPAYYGRFGFLPDRRVEPPFPFPPDLPPQWRDAWQSANLGEAAAALAGRLRVPAPWNKPELWQP